LSPELLSPAHVLKNHPKHVMIKPREISLPGLVLVWRGLIDKNSLFVGRSIGNLSLCVKHNKPAEI
jgi:hypothetical protein